MKTGPSRRYDILGRSPMGKTKFTVFENTIQKTHVWLHYLMEELDWEDKPKHAYVGLRSVLHALRDRLTVEEAVHLGAQLPMLVRGFYYEGWKLTGKPVKERHEAEFLQHVEKAFKNDPSVEAKNVVRAVFKLLDRHVTAGEIDDVKHMLPKALQKLWT
jgi:uncharacterized protein (DUF2267 family)